MSGSFSAWLETQLLSHVFGGIFYPMPSAIYVGLFTSPPTITGGGTEVSGGGYVRMQAVFGAPYGTPPAMNNPAAIQWGAAGAAWGTITAGALFDAATAGDMLGSAILVDPTDGITPAPKQIGVGDVFRIPVANLIVGFVTPPSSSSAMLARTMVRPIGARRVSVPA